MASLAKQQRCKPPEPPPTHPACFFLSSLSSCLMDTPLGCCPDAVLHGSANCELQHHGAGERVGGGRFTGRRRRRQGVIRHAVRAHLTSLSATTALARGKRQETTAAAEEKMRQTKRRTIQAALPTMMTTTACPPGDRETKSSSILAVARVPLLTL